MSETRQNKVARLVQKELSEMFLLELKSKPGIMISVTSVRLTPDFSYARVFLSVFPPKDAEETVKAIQSNTKQIRYDLGQRIRYQFRSVPELSFQVDDSLDYADKIDNLLK